jgi:hypothetical protein
MKITDRSYKGSNIYIISKSQAAIKAFDSLEINSNLVRYCHQSLVKLAELNRIQLVWMPGHMGIDGNETADELTRQGFPHPLIWPKSELGISAKVGRVVIRDWTTRKCGSIGTPYMGKRKLRTFLKKKKTLCKKSWRIAQPEQKQVMNIDTDANRTLSFKRTPIETGACDQSWV